MRIAIVAQPFDVVPPERGGSLAIWATELASRLVSEHELTIYCHVAEGQERQSVHDGIRCTRVSIERDERVMRILGFAERAIGKALRRRVDLFYRYYYFGRGYCLGYIRAIARQIREQGADVVVVSNFSQFVPTLRAHLRSEKIILAMHCDWLIELDPGVVRRRLALVDGVCGCSGYIVQGVANAFPEHSAKCFPLHNGNNPELFADSVAATSGGKEIEARYDLTGKTVIAFVGRVAPEKGVHVLVEAMKRVLRERSDVALLVVGGISAQPPSPRWSLANDERFREFEELKKNYKEHLVGLAAGNENAIHFVGDVSYFELPKYYRRADIFVHPAVWNEPFGMIITEAMACGRPVVSTRAGGIPEIVIEGETGLLAEPGDPRSLAGAILELVSDPARREAMGRAGKLRVAEKFTWDHTAAAFCVAVDEIVKRDSEPR
jgi:glycosyltransferase involved in cell wall biosynthesis